MVLSFPFAEKMEPKTRIKPADLAYFSVADGYLQHGMQRKQTNVIGFCQLSIQFLGRIKWSGSCEFLIFVLYAFVGKSLKFVVQYLVQFYVGINWGSSL